MANNEPDLPVLYSFRRCPYAMRARLALSVADIPCELREVLLRDKPPEMLEASPKGTVPVLVESDGAVIDESLAVMLWALRQHDPEGWLRPDQGTVDEMLTLIDTFDREFKLHLDRYKYPDRYDDVDPLEHREQASRHLVALDRSLERRRYLFGERPSLADMALVPFVRQFAHVDKTWFGAQNWAHLTEWLNTILNSDRFVSMMGKYPRWSPHQEQRVVFPEPR